jgi:hypothetical protein
MLEKTSNKIEGIPIVKGMHGKATGRMPNWTMKIMAVILISLASAVFSNAFGSIRLRFSGSSSAF